MLGEKGLEKCTIVLKPPLWKLQNSVVVTIHKQMNRTMFQQLHLQRMKLEFYLIFASHKIFSCF